MNSKFPVDRLRWIRWSQTIGFLFISSPIAFTAPQVQAQPSPLNPCPGIYYEEPFNSTRIVPRGCPANTATQQQIQQGQSFGQPINVPNRSVLQSSEMVQPQSQAGTAIASVSPMNGLVNIQLRNDTNTSIAYQAIGQTQESMLRGGESIMLNGLPVPVTVTMYRPDGGFIQVIPTASNQPGMIAVNLSETEAFSQSARTIRVQPDGQIYLN